MQIYCLLVSSVSITTAVADDLFDISCEMIRQKKHRENFCTDKMEGSIETYFEQKNMGSISGTEFIAIIDTPMGTGTVKFIVRKSDVEKRNKLVWAPYMPGRYSSAYN